MLTSPAVHLLIPTHTTRHLAACLAGVAWQTRLPDAVVVTCDTDDPAIGGLLEKCWGRILRVIEERGLAAPVLLHTFRPHQGEARLNQVRNNGLRALKGAVGLRESDQIVVLDGDTILAPDAIFRHARLARAGFELVIPFRTNLGERASEALSEERVLAAARTGRLPAEIAHPREPERLSARERRYRLQLMLKSIPVIGQALVKPHKLKVLGGHHAVSVRCLLAVNGYDEDYVGYGYDDDDLSRRVYSTPRPPKVAIAIRRIHAYHLWHETRAPARPTQAPGYERFRRKDLPTIARHGWKTPNPQPTPEITRIGDRTNREAVPASSRG